ncbi:hypothetical protein RvY_12442 [Ramazzottius varieornatus]|uniref:Choline transporter-like protein n=1 Tax=Ramazzottius varieornatus TaxID=947166 RepID=A0A1D1VLT2_RAMVA|nr:hypothetical protein RvY_12442 [Ramazzottius varieornatus]
MLGVAAYFFFASGTDNTGLLLNYIWVPTVTIIMGSYVIASAFFSVYEMAIDTLFICFLEDVERNDGSDQKPYFMPRRLMLLLGKHNAKIRPGEASSKKSLAPVYSEHRVTLK